MDETVFWGHSRDGHGGVPEADRVGDDHCMGVTFEKSVAAIVVSCWVNVEPIVGVEVP